MGGGVTKGFLVLLLGLSVFPVWAGEITVSAATSLAEAFGELAAQYETDNPGDRIRLNVAASGVLLQQLDKGAPVDVLAVADRATLDVAENKGLIDPDSKRDFARNRLVLVTAMGNGVSITDLNDLASPPFKRIAVGNPEFVPAGRYARAALEQAGLWSLLEERMIRTQNVRQALDYVSRGEVDAGFVYATDVMALADRVQVILEVPVPEPVSYAVALTATSRDATAQRFVAYLFSAVGQEVLARRGFSAP